MESGFREIKMSEKETCVRLNEVEWVRRGLDIVSEKWAVLVVYSLQSGTMRLSELQRGIEGISQKMLIQTLRKLEQNGLVERTVYPVVPPKVEYSLTPLGETLIEPLVGICDWTARHDEKMREARDNYNKERGK